MLPVSVNISRVSLYYSSVVEKYESIIRSFDLDSKYIQLEITESATASTGDMPPLVTAVRITYAPTMMTSP